MQTALFHLPVQSALLLLPMQTASPHLPTPTLLPLASIQSVFPVVLFGAIALFVAVGLFSMFTRRNSLHDQIGQGGLFLGDELSSGGTSGFDTTGGSGVADGPGGAGGWSGEQRAGGLESQAERELEIRQMLTARSDRLVRQGHAPLDIDAELAKLDWLGAGGSGRAEAEGPGDAALANEVRQLVRARNERRERQGLDALDVEAEVQRTLAELNPQ